MLWSPLELVVSWQLHPAFEELVENLGVNDAVGEGNTAVSVGGGGRILEQHVSFHLPGLSSE